MRKTIITLIFLLISILTTGQIVTINEKMEFDYFTIYFNNVYRQPELATYMLVPHMLEKNVKRSNKFYDSYRHVNPYTTKDYKNSGYDRGHLVPAADMTFSSKGMKQSFEYVNMTFQHRSFNRGKWKVLENKVRKWCMQFDTVYVATGPIFTFEKDSYENYIPDKFFKVILVKNESLYECVAFVIPNLKNKSDYKPLSNYIHSVDEVEYITGYDFFNGIDELLEEQKESDINYLFWFDE